MSRDQKRPGWGEPEPTFNRSGCSTLLKTIAGETHGIYIDKESEINYQGGQLRSSFPSQR